MERNLQVHLEITDGKDNHVGYGVISPIAIEELEETISRFIKEARQKEKEKNYPNISDCKITINIGKRIW